jgi:L-threonylcarbamoyladenylate synthase
VKRTLRWHQQKDLDIAANILRQGGVIAGTSDTVLGLLAATSHEGYLALNTIKRRGNKPYLILLNNTASFLHYAQKPTQGWVYTLMEQFWPGPLTLILSARDGLPTWMQGSDSTVAIRIPNHAGLRALIDRVGPLFSTSANLAGHSVPLNIDEIDAIIVHQLGALINNDQAPSAVPSTMVDCTGDVPIIIRDGAIPAVDIFALSSP